VVCHGCSFKEGITLDERLRRAVELAKERGVDLNTGLLSELCHTPIDGRR